MTPSQLFISYSHADESFLTEFEKHLSTLKRENLISTWHDRKIAPGRNWAGEIDEALQRSDIIVFLISPDFVASEYCIEKEVAVALEKHYRGEVIVIPIVVRSVDWLTTAIGKIQALPKDANPISTRNDKDQAWLEVTIGIRSAINDLERRRTYAPSQPLFCGISQALSAEVDRLEKRFTNDSFIGGISTGLHDLDTLIDGLHEDDLVLVATTPVMDRMAFLVSIISHICVEKSLPGLIFSLKQSKEQIARRLCAALGKIPVRALLRGELEENDWGRLTYALGTINDKAIGIVDQTHLDINTITSQIDKFRDQHSSCALVVIDHFEHVTGGNRPELLTILGRYSHKNKIPIVVACGLERDPSSRPNKRPVLSDIGEWGVLNEDIDVVIFTYQDEQYDLDSPDKGIAEVIVAKNSRGPVGMVITTYLREEQVLMNTLTSAENR